MLNCLQVTIILILLLVNNACIDDSISEVRQMQFSVTNGLRSAQTRLLLVLSHSISGLSNAATLVARAHASARTLLWNWLR